jgi:alpha-mannosidase
LIITAFKVSENHPQNLILRFYECHGESSSLPTLNLKSEFFTLGNPVDLLERNILPTVNPIAPWKISTFQVITQER